MSVYEKTINTFSTRVRQMILQYQKLKKENERLNTVVGERDAEIKRLRLQLSQAQRDYDSLKMAKMVEISEGDMEGLRNELLSSFAMSTSASRSSVRNNLGLRHVKRETTHNATPVQQGNVCKCACRR